MLFVFYIYYIIIIINIPGSYRLIYMIFFIYYIPLLHVFFKMFFFHDVQTPWVFWFRLLGRMVITEVFSAHWGGPNSCHQGRVLAVLWDEPTENQLEKWAQQMGILWNSS